MNIIERGKAFVQSLLSAASGTAWQWRRCPHWGSTLTSKWGSYKRHPWYLEGQREVVIPRHRCSDCGRTYSEERVQLRRRCWYAREVRRCALDSWLHLGSSRRKASPLRAQARRVAEWLRSWLGKQERYLLWRVPGQEEAGAEPCRLSASTVERWLDEAGVQAKESVAGQLEGLGAVAADGLWARLRAGAKRVVLLLVDPASGLLLPPIVALGEESGRYWQGLFARAHSAGLELEEVRGVTSDWVGGLVRESLAWLMHQRCLWHFWRNPSGLSPQGRSLSKPLAQACAGLAGAAGQGGTAGPGARGVGCPQL